ncbi:thiamine-phosphate kinase [Thermogladius sp. 4427co]|uniref:thiamine-phosphate kinase n=1 Tax=Thermogladius sp. 4427co TaxID=3450718 RepID=UPI003F79DB86
MARLGYTEREFIDQVVAKYLAKGNPFSVLEFPDDAFDFIPFAPRIIASVDASSIKNVRLPWRSLEDAAWSIVSGAVSDHVVKGSLPAYALVSIGLSKAMENTQAEEIVKGLAGAFSYYGVKWVGGDTNSSDDPWVSVTLIGFTTAKKPPSRKKARPGDAVIVTGRYGAMGFVVVKGFEAASSQDWVIKYTRRPVTERRLAIVVSANYKFIHASMDVSDGLGYTLLEISRLSNVGIRITRPPQIYNEVLEYCGSRLDCVYELSLNGGEEYGGVLVVGKSYMKNVIEDLESYNIPFEVVGEITEGYGLRVEGVEGLKIYYWDQLGDYKIIELV